MPFDFSGKYITNTLSVIVYILNVVSGESVTLVLLVPHDGERSFGTEVEAIMAWATETVSV